jgi:putative resolvase
MTFGRFLSIGTAALLLGVCTKTLRRWDRAGKLHPAFRTAGNHRRYDRQSLLTKLRTNVAQSKTNGGASPLPIRTRAAIYGRVSSARQRKAGDLERQLRQLRAYCSAHAYRAVQTYSDIGSGLNDRRKGLLRLFRDVAAGKVDVVVVNYQDRLARFGIQIIRQFLTSWAVSLEIIHPTVVESSPHAELITDLTAILYSFMGKLYRLRRHS